MNVVTGSLRRHRTAAVLALIGISSIACTSGSPGPGDGSPNANAGGPGQTGGGANAGGAGNTGGGTFKPQDLTNGGPKLRILTQSEYKSSLTYLLGEIKTPLELPDDTMVAGFVSIGATQGTINASSVELYETASRAAAAEVFGDAPRWQKLVGCQPAADLSDACAGTFIKNLGKHAFRRDLTDPEVQQWLKVGKDAAALPGSSAALALSTVTSGLLQSPYFLYRVEVNKLDAAAKRLMYDGPSMATRLAYLLTGAPPTDALLADAASKKLDTPDGIKAAVAPLLGDGRVLDRMTAFFSEYSQASLVSVVQKSPEMYANFTPALRSSMLQATDLFIRNIVLAQGADVRSFFDSDQTFIDSNLAPLYGVAAPASGFMQIKLTPESGRAGILGQAAVLAGHSQPDHTSPTRRGVFISRNFLCVSPPPPPDGVIPELKDNPSLTARQKLDAHRTAPSCAACHSLFDPLGFGLEHLDSIGQYRPTENGLTIDATGMLDNVAYDGGAQMGATFRQNARVMRCMVDNFYRNANGLVESKLDAAQVDALAQTLTAKNYVWRDLVADFVASDAFRSAPAVAAPMGNQ